MAAAAMLVAYPAKIKAAGAANGPLTGARNREGACRAIDRLTGPFSLA